MFEKIIKPILILVAAIIACAILIRSISGNETLSQYAEKHPEIAYESVSVTGNSSDYNSDSDANSSAAN